MKLLWLSRKDWKDIARNVAVLTVLIIGLAVFTGISSAATVYVAATDAPAEWKVGTNVTCDGTNDQVEINAAIAARAAGDVVSLSPGNFQIAGDIDSKAGVWLRGSGKDNVTVLNFTTTSFNQISISHDDAAQVSDFRMTGRTKINVHDSDHVNVSSIWMLKTYNIRQVDGATAALMVDPGGSSIHDVMIFDVDVWDSNCSAFGLNTYSGANTGRYDDIWLEKCDALRIGMDYPTAYATYVTGFAMLENTRAANITVRDCSATDILDTGLQTEPVGSYAVLESPGMRIINFTADRTNWYEWWGYGAQDQPGGVEIQQSNVTLENVTTNHSTIGIYFPTWAEDAHVYNSSTMNSRTAGLYLVGQTHVEVRGFNSTNDYLQTSTGGWQRYPIYLYPQGTVSTVLIDNATILNTTGASRPGLYISASSSSPNKIFVNSSRTVNMGGGSGQYAFYNAASTFANLYQWLVEGTHSGDHYHFNDLGMGTPSTPAITLTMNGTYWRDDFTTYKPASYSNSSHTEIDGGVPNLVNMTGTSDETFVINKTHTFGSMNISARYNASSPYGSSGGGIMWGSNSSAEGTQTDYYDVFINIDTGSLSLRWHTGGTTQTMNTTKIPTERYMWHDLAVHYVNHTGVGDDGALIDVFWNGTPVLHWVDSVYNDQPFGFAGFRSAGSSCKFFDDLNIVPLSHTTIAANITTFYVGATVQFNDTTVRPYSNGFAPTYAWAFGDGGTSTEQNATHTFNTVGTWSSQLTMTDEGGTNISAPITIAVLALPSVPPIAGFTGTPTSGYTPLTVVFTDGSIGNPSGWSWTFGDGGSSLLQNPTHQYTAAGAYTVALTVYNASGSDTETKAGYIVVTNPPSVVPVAAFTANITAGDMPLAVNFTDQSSCANCLLRYWQFGDGNASFAQNPTWVYESPGIYTVALTVTNASGSDTETKTGYITVTVPLLPGETPGHNWSRPRAVSTPIPVSTYQVNALFAVWGGMEKDPTNNTAMYLPDVEAFAGIVASVYTDVLGNIALVLIFGAIFFMMYLITDSITMPSVVGIITSGFIIWRLPETYHMVAWGAIALSVVAIVYTLYKEGK